MTHQFDHNINYNVLLYYKVSIKYYSMVLKVFKFPIEMMFFFFNLAPLFKVDPLQGYLVI